MNTEKVKKTDYIESIDANSKDGMTLKFYNFITPKKFGETELGIQEKGVKHKEYKEMMKNEGGIPLY